MTNDQILFASLQDSIDIAPFGFCLLNKDGLNVIHMNHAFGSMMGAHHLPQGGPVDIRQIMPPESLAFIANQPQRSFSYDTEIAYENQDSRWVRIHVEHTLHHGDSYLCLWVNDITGIRQSAIQNAEALKTMEQAAEMKANLLATMSHEIRTPMQSVFGFLELIAEEKPEKKILDMVGTARSSAADLLEILDDVLDLAKLDADKMELDDFEIPVRTLAYGILEALEVKKYGTNVELLHDIDKDVPFVVKGDPKRLRQILINLMGNSLKFTREGHVKLTITDKCEHIKPKSGLGLRVAVSDTGIGMSEEACNRLFKPFMQADNSTTREFGGTGLGLSICKKLIGLMGGEIGVFSKEGEGSTFWFEIPTQAVSTDQTTVELPNLEGYVVLVVEDHPKAIVEISNSLRSMGAEVEACTTYAEGLELIKRRPFDACVVDQSLPDGYGLNLIRDINDARPYCGLVMYTVHDDYSIKNALRSLGAVHLLKPASRAGLGEAVKGVVKKITSHKLEGPDRLLIAEDTAAVREILQKQLDKLGIDADFAENGKIALDMLETGNYGILFTDLHMPEIDGYKVIKTIRGQEKEDGKDTRFPVVVLTADVQMAQRQTYMELGFDECLLKPVSLAQVRRLMMRWGLLAEEMLEESLLKENKDAPDTPLPKPLEEENTPPMAIDLDELKNMMGDLDDMTMEMMGMFSEMTQPLVADLKKSYEDKDYEALSEHAHSLKGSARSACAIKLGDIAADLQDEAVEASDERRDELVTGILHEFEIVQLCIQKLQKDGFPSDA